MTHLYELTGQYQCLERENDEGEDVFGVLEVELAAITEKIEDKAESIGKYVLSLNAEADTIKAEETRLSARRKSIENKATWLKGYLLHELQNANLDKVKTELVTITVRTNPPSVNVIDQETIPQEYQRCIPEVWEVDKRAIIDQFKNTGEIVSGVELITNKKSLQIR